MYWFKKKKKVSAFSPFDFQCLSRKKEYVFLYGDTWHFVMYLIFQNEKNGDTGNYTRRP